MSNAIHYNLIQLYKMWTFHHSWIILYLKKKTIKGGWMMTFMKYKIYLFLNLLNNFEN